MPITFAIVSGFAVALAGGAMWALTRYKALGAGLAALGLLFGVGLSVLLAVSLQGM